MKKSQKKKSSQLPFLQIGFSIFVFILLLIGFFVVRLNQDTRSKASGPRQVCSPGNRTGCGADGCSAQRQKICQPNGQFGPCVNSTTCGYSGAGNGTACSLNTHCQSGYCHPTTRVCANNPNGGGGSEPTRPPTAAGTALTCWYLNSTVGGCQSVSIQNSTVATCYEQNNLGSTTYYYPDQAACKFFNRPVAQTKLCSFYDPRYGCFPDRVPVSTNCTDRNNAPMGNEMFDHPCCNNLYGSCGQPLERTRISTEQNSTQPQLTTCYRPEGWSLPTYQCTTVYHAGSCSMLEEIGYQYSSCPPNKQNFADSKTCYRPEGWGTPSYKCTTIESKSADCSGNPDGYTFTYCPPNQMK